MAENLVENARLKRQHEAGITVQVSLTTAPGGAALRVRDDGTPVPAAVREQLFHGAVASATGLGIGLYQAARHAQENGYRLSLLEGDADDLTGVVFELAPEAGGGSAGGRDA